MPIFILPAEANVNNCGTSDWWMMGGYKSNYMDCSHQTKIEHKKWFNYLHHIKLIGKEAHIFGMNQTLTDILLRAASILTKLVWFGLIFYQLSPFCEL